MRQLQLEQKQKQAEADPAVVEAEAAIAEVEFRHYHVFVDVVLDSLLRLQILGAHGFHLLLQLLRQRRTILVVLIRVLSATAGRAVW